MTDFHGINVFMHAFFKDFLNLNTFAGVFFIIRETYYMVFKRLLNIINGLNKQTNKQIRKLTKDFPLYFCLPLFFERLSGSVEIF